jgi:hypothetical protein
MSGLRRSERSKRPKKVFEQSWTPRPPPEQNKSSRIVPKPLQTRPAEPPATTAIKELLDQPHDQFTPPIQVQFASFKVHWVENDPFSLFIKFLGDISLLAIVDATNARAASVMPFVSDFARSWSPITKGELLCWIGLLLYMANHTEKRRKDYWPRLDPFMKQKRWEQIHRFLTFNIVTITPLLNKATSKPWWHRVEPIYSTIRSNCRSAVTPST